MSRAVVIGGGTMGAGIVTTLLLAGDDVELVEVADGAQERVRGVLARGKRSSAEVDAALARLRVLDATGKASPAPDVLIEAVPERVELKRSVLAQAEALEPALLGSNTSSLSIGELAADLRRPEAFVGLHFFNPVPVMGLIEVVVGPATADATVDAAVALTRRLGKEPVVVNDSPGFASSRLGIALGLEAIRMVEDGVAEPGAIDKAMELGYRHPVGPLRLTDIVGLDVRLDIARHLHSVYGERFAPPALLERMVGEGRLGRKAGRGFYDWETA
jgi:3-hydroxybutyryl-CoA dehydrogenase